jgi:CheY-like chemotaxis protein
LCPKHLEISLKEIKAEMKKPTHGRRSNFKKLRLYALILMDIRLPGENNLELTKKVKA